MRGYRKVVFVSLALLILLGCALMPGTPTPLPWIATATPGAGGEPTITPMSNPTSQPLPSPTTTWATSAPASTPAPGVQQVYLDAPQHGDTVANPLVVRGRTAVMPFEATLVVRVYDAWGQLASLTPITVRGEYGQPATFEATIFYGGVPGAGRVEVVEISARDGSDMGLATVHVTLAGYPGGSYIELPAPYSKQTLPLPLLARVGRPGEQVKVTVSWGDGTQFSRDVTLLPGLDGRGLLVLPVDWTVEPRPAHPPTQDGAIHIHDMAGRQLAWQPVILLHPTDPDTTGIVVYWARGERIEAQSLRVPRTQAIGRASLEMLLWGPVPGNPYGYQTAIPLPDEILAYAHRGVDWGERVRINKLTIVEGVARVDFSRELLANPGGSARVVWMRQQIEQTLLQFSTVNRVEITVDGQSAVLEP